MTTHRLLLPGEHRKLRRPTTRDLIWNERRYKSSFHTSFGPTGRDFGAGLDLAPMADEAMDFLRLAVAVYLVDRTSPRPARGWDREFELEVPVSDPDRWNAMALGLAGLLDFMTGDEWALTFRAGPTVRRRRPINPLQSDLVCLFSGGADSFSGAALARQRETPPLLVGHWDSTTARGAQIRAYGAQLELGGQPAPLMAVHLARRKSQIRTGEKFGTEPTSRSRSLVFIALGLAAASAVGSGDLWVPENGWVSLNTPLGAGRRGSLSTRTTHPGLVDEIGAMTREIGIDVSITNPWESRTKGEVFAWMREEFGSESASESLSATHSCARSDARWEHMPPGMHCGVCFACLVRRSAFIAGGLPDQTEYIENAFVGDRRDEWLTPARLRDVQAVRAAAARGGFSIEDVLALDLPERLNPAAALDLANRGLAEVRQVEIR